MNFLAKDFKELRKKAEALYFALGFGLKFKAYGKCIVELPNRENKHERSGEYEEIDLAEVVVWGLENSKKGIYFSINGAVYRVKNVDNLIFSVHRD